MSFENLSVAAPDPILSLIVRFANDDFPQKVDLGPGAYRTEEGKPYVFGCVRDAEKEVVADHTLNKEYQPQDGNQEFLKGARGVLFGWDHPMVTSDKVVSAQSLSGGGALRLLCEFLQEHRPAELYHSDPTWGNHPKIFEKVGITAKTYRYYHKETRGLDFEGMMEDLGNATEGACILLHTCAHNPTGVDPTFEQWKQIAEVCKAKKLYPFFDTAYQGFVTGDLGKDGAALRYFVDQGFEMCIAQSFAKILGVYGERIGACHFITGSKDVAKAVLSHLKASIRVNWSSPPLHGGRIAALILNNEEKRASWLAELVTVTDRIAKMRVELHKALLENKCPGSWDHVVNQIGMFSYTGLTPAQCGQMVDKHHIYLTPNGRISVSGLNMGNVTYTADCIKDVVENY